MFCYRTIVPQSIEFRRLIVLFDASRQKPEGSLSSIFWILLVYEVLCIEPDLGQDGLRTVGDESLQSLCCSNPVLQRLVWLEFLHQLVSILGGIYWKISQLCA